MPQYNYLKNNFTSGQISRRLDVRSDLLRHKNGCTALENMVVMPHGGARSRPGTKFLVEVKDSSKITRLIDFQSSVEDSYIVEMGDQYFRFIKNRAQIESGGSAYEVAHVYEEADVRAVKVAQSVDVMFMVHPDYPVKQLTRNGDTSWTFTDVEFVDGPYQEIQIGGTTLTLDANSGTINVVASAPLFAATDTSGTGGTGRVDRHIRIQDGTDWLPCKIVSYTSSTEVAIEIQDVPGLDPKVFSGHGSGNAKDTFQLGVWSDTTGYPSVIAFYENRLMFANSPTEKETIRGSKQDDYTRFSPDDGDADAVSFIATAERLNAIQWMSPNKTLRVGSNGSEFDFSGGSDNLSVSPTNIRVIRTTNYGANAVLPITVENSTLFWQRSGKVLREYNYSFEQDNFVAGDLTLVSEGIAKDRALEMSFQLEPDNVIWVVTEGGRLLGFTYMPDQEVAAWHVHPMSGTDVKVKSLAVIPSTEEDELYLIVSRTVDGSTVQYIEYLSETFVDKTNKDAYFVDCGVHYRGETPAATLTPASVSGNNITFTASTSVFSASDVGRVIRAGDAKAIITGYTSGTVVTANITRNFPSTDAIAANSWTLSSNVVTGLSHLEGETVTILADGGTHPNKTVVSGQVTLEGQYTDVAVGYGYTQKLAITPIDYASNTGTQLGNRSRITEITLAVFESIGGKVGKDFTKLRPMFENVAVYGEGPALVTQDKVVRPNHPHADDATVAVQQDQPLPLTVLGIIAKVETSNAR